MDKEARRSFIRVPRVVGNRTAKTKDDGVLDGGHEFVPVERVNEKDSEHERIVIPRQDRGEAYPPTVDVELREVRHGATSKGPYLRVIPRQRRLMKSAPGHLEATLLASSSGGPLSRSISSIKQILIGSPFATSRLLHERLSKTHALGVFSSDPLSSCAYSAEEIMLVLILAGSAALYLTLPITIVLLLLLWVVRLSYLQTIRAYPNGGGAYIVARANLGQTPGLVAAAALMVDYILTVSVSVAAGVAAITSAIPDLLSLSVPISLIAIGLITWGNLRGVRESGTIFGLPTYFFVLSFGVMIVVGLAKTIAGEAPGSLLHAATPQPQGDITEALTFFLILRAFSSGAAALTGVEAISNGVPAFKPPEAQNARTTMQWEAALLGFLLLGVAFLSTRYGLAPSHDETLVSMLGREILGENVLYYAYQVATAAVLLLAANTAYADFPRLAALLAKDRFVPRQLSFRGDRLAFSNGIILLGGATSLFIIAFDAQVTRLIPLYVLGVFILMTLSQLGMVKHWRRIREAGWKSSIVINGIGAAATGVVTLIVGSSKLTHGAWISLLAMLVLIVLFILIRHHYDWFHRQVQVTEGESDLHYSPSVAEPLRRDGSFGHVIIPVDEINKVTLGAATLARQMSGLINAVHVTDERDEAEALRTEWNNIAPDIPLLIIESPYRAYVGPMLAYVESLARSTPGGIVTVVLPNFRTRHWWEKLLHNRDVSRLQRLLRALPNIRVIESPFHPV